MMNCVAIGDCRDVLKTLPADTFHCCVTSPPYWGLRDYGHADQIGLEPTPDEYVSEIVGVFREVRRVLRDDGTLWLNLGDTYITNPRGPQQSSSVSSTLTGTPDSERRRQRWEAMPHPNDRTTDPKVRGRSHASATGRGARVDGLKHKDMVGIPWRVALALQADGWWLRSDIIWHKPNPMPESVTDRPTKAHEYVFLFAKSERYFYDSKAIAESSVTGVTGGAYSAPGQTPHSNARGEVVSIETATRNARSVWSVTSQPYSGAHFATMPPKLIERCVLAGSPEGGAVLDPFFGSGTVGEVAERLGRQWFGIELNPDYKKLIDERTAQAGLRFAP